VINHHCTCRVPIQNSTTHLQNSKYKNRYRQVVRVWSRDNDVYVGLFQKPQSYRSSYRGSYQTVVRLLIFFLSLITETRNHNTFGSFGREIVFRVPRSCVLLIVFSSNVRFNISVFVFWFFVLFSCCRFTTPWRIRRSVNSSYEEIVDTVLRVGSRTRIIEKTIMATSITMITAQKKIVSKIEYSVALHYCSQSVHCYCGLVL